MDDRNAHGGYWSNPNCHRVDLSRVTVRELVYHLTAAVAGIRDDFPDRFEHLEQVVQGESNDWKEILEDIGSNLESLQQTIDDCHEGQEGDDGVKALVRQVEEQVTELQTAQDRLMDLLATHESSSRMRLDDMKCTFSHMCDAQTKFLRAELRALRKTLYHEAPQFPQFGKLPVEIRFMIWDLALPRRMVCLQEWYNEHPREFAHVHYSFTSSFPPPPVAHTCRESRAVACQSGRLVSIRNVRAPVSGVLLRPVQWAWFDARRDTLHLQPKLNNLHDLQAIRDITSRAHHVAIEYGPYGDSVANYFAHLFSPYHFPLLKTIDIVGETFLQFERSDPVLEARLFGRDGRYPVTIDKNNEAATDALIKRLRANHSSEDVDKVERFLKAKTNFDGFPQDRIHYDDQIWRDRLKQLRGVWLGTQCDWDVLGGEGKEGTMIKVDGLDKPGLTSDWVRMMRRRMPTIRRMALLRLDYELNDW